MFHELRKVEGATSASPFDVLPAAFDVTQNQIHLEWAHPYLGIIDARFLGVQKLLGPRRKRFRRVGSGDGSDRCGYPCGDAHLFSGVPKRSGEIACGTRAIQRRGCCHQKDGTNHSDGPADDVWYSTSCVRAIRLHGFACERKTMGAARKACCCSLPPTRRKSQAEDICRY